MEIISYFSISLKRLDLRFTSCSFEADVQQHCIKSVNFIVPDCIMQGC